MIDAEKLKVHYVTDESGRRTAVITSIDEFRGLLEDIDDLAAVAERRGEPTVAHADVVAGLKRDGLL